MIISFLKVAYFFADRAVRTKCRHDWIHIVLSEISYHIRQVTTRL